MNLRELLLKGHEAQQKEHAEREAAKLGTLRVGSVGCVTDDGKIVGECHRVAVARMLGVDKEVGLDSELMFAGGRGNEVLWEEVLSKSWSGKIRKEEEIPVEWTVPETDVKVSGRPDMVLCGEDGTPQYGLELKSIHSYSTAAGVFLGVEPQLKHLIQAGTYSMFLDIPFVLCYANRNVWKLNHWDKKRYPGAGDIRPFYSLFYLEWKDSRLYYRHEDSNDWVATMVTQDGIKGFYKMVVEMRDAKELGPRPVNLDAKGDNMPWDRCDYCPHQNACDEKEDSFDEWLLALKNS